MQKMHKLYQTRLILSNQIDISWDPYLKTQTT